MARLQKRSNRKASGGRYTNIKTKRKVHLARQSTMTKLAERKAKVLRVLGGNIKRFLLSEKTINVASKDGKVQKTTIKNVIENKANPHLVRRNILTKGAIVETDLGKVRVTSRPGQQAVVSGVLVE